MDTSNIDAGTPGLIIGISAGSLIAIVGLLIAYLKWRTPKQ